MKIRPVGAQLFPCGQTDGEKDGRDEAKTRFSQFCGRA
jgi:hypothetical protein